MSTPHSNVSHANEVFLFAIAIAFIVPSVAEQLLGVPPKYAWVGVLVYVAWISYIGVVRAMVMLPPRDPKLAEIEQMRSWVLLTGLPFIFTGNIIPHLLGLDANLSNLPVFVVVIMLPFYLILYLVTSRVPSLVFSAITQSYKKDQKEWLQWQVLIPTASTTFAISIVGVQLGLLIASPVDASSLVVTLILIGIMGWRVLVNERRARLGATQLSDSITNPKHRLPRFGIRRLTF